MNKAYLLALPALALVAVAALVSVSAHPLLNAENMTQEQKDIQIQVLELEQERIADQIAYLNGDITQEQLQERVQANMDAMQPLREQLRETMGDEEGGCGMGHGRFGHGMMWGF